MLSSANILRIQLRPLAVECRIHVQNHSSRPQHWKLKTLATRNDDGRNEKPPSPQPSGPFVRAPPVISYDRISICRRCSGSKKVDCAGCSGTGLLPAGGYHARNPISSARIVGSSWTAMERTFGWRHFRVTQKQKKGKENFVKMVATCDETVQLWVNMKNLKDRAAWAAGWLQKKEMRDLEANVGGTECKSCGGTGLVTCPLCSLAGVVVEL